MFLYSMTRRLLNATRSDSGADLRSTLKAMVRFGVPPEQHWPYQEDRLHEDPLDPFLFTFHDDYESLVYCRLDQPTWLDLHTANPKRPSESSGQLSGRASPRLAGKQTLRRVTRFLAAGFPSVFGFFVTGSTSASGNIELPAGHDKLLGGEAAVAIGFDDARCALQIQPTWGTQWGVNGCAWLPYEYVENGLAGDFWTILHRDWIKSAQLTRPRGLRLPRKEEL